MQDCTESDSIPTSEEANGGDTLDWLGMPLVTSRYLQKEKRKKSQLQVGLLDLADWLPDLIRSSLLKSEYQSELSRPDAT